MTDAIIKNGVRIFRPSEVNKLLSAIPSQQHKLMIKSLLFTGLRYVELQRLLHNPEWLQNRFIHLPKQAVFKQKRRQLDRYVRLTRWGYDTVNMLLQLDVDLPSRQALNKDLQKWGLSADLDNTGICIKSFRKTWESWLMFVYPDRITEITLSQGHTTITSIKHYLNMPFNEYDKIEMQDFVGSWIN